MNEGVGEMEGAREETERQVRPVRGCERAWAGSPAPPLGTPLSPPRPAPPAPASGPAAGRSPLDCWDSRSLVLSPATS